MASPHSHSMTTRNNFAGSRKYENTEYLQYEDLRKAVHNGDWNAAGEFLKHHPGAAVAKITILKQTALHVAVRAGHEHIVEKLVDLMSEEDLAILDTYGSTALIETANTGNKRMAVCMLRKNNNLVTIKDRSGYIPFDKAIAFGHMELARYLYALTPPEYLHSSNGAKLCARAINSRILGNNSSCNYPVPTISDDLKSSQYNFLFVRCWYDKTDIALDLIQRFPSLALIQPSPNGQRALCTHWLLWLMHSRVEISLCFGNDGFTPVYTFNWLLPPSKLV